MERYKVTRCLLLDRLNERGISQTKFADDLNVSKQQVNDWVHTRRLMSVEYLKIIIANLKLDGIDDLYEFESSLE